MASRGAKSGKGLDQVRAMIEGAQVVALRPDAPGPALAPLARDDDQDSGLGGARRRVRRNMLPDGCPVEPLGTFEGVYFYLDELKQIRALKPKEHEKKNLESLFGRRSDLCEKLWPRFHAKAVDPQTGEPLVNGWKPEEAGRQFMAACAHAGIWRAQGRVRGAGAHRGERGELILHCGDRIWIGDRWDHPGKTGELVYPAAEKLPRFAVSGVGREAGERLLALLATWNWERGADAADCPEGDYGVDPMLALGFLAGASVCGALAWRPSAWLTGGRGTGKSFLQDHVIKPFFGAGLIEAKNASEAYIRQLLGMRTLPVALDEQEAAADNRKTQAIIELARVASSGGKIGRGGQDHNPHEFTAQSAFLFSSILTPPLSPQDRSRMAMLELKPFPDGAKPPVLDPKEISDLGLAIRRRMVDGWERLADTIGLYKKWLGEFGHDARMQDQFGTLLACADLVLFDDLADEEDYARGWASRLDARWLAEKADDESEGALCVRHIATSTLQAVGGAAPQTVSMFIQKAIGDHEPFQGDGVETARQRLEANGLKLVSSWLGGDGRRKIGAPAPADPARPIYVAVANRHRGLDALMRDTRWNGGVWSQAAKRMAGAVAKHNVRIAGRNEWSVLVPIADFVALGGEYDGDGGEGAA